MEEHNVLKQSSLRSNNGLKSTLSGKSTPRNSPSFWRSSSGRTPRREGRTSGVSSHWFRNNRVVLWLLLITLWAYAGFYVQSRWAHGDNKEGIFVYGNRPVDGRNLESEPEQTRRRDLIANNESLTLKNGTTKIISNVDYLDVSLAEKENGVSAQKRTSRKMKKKKKKKMKKIQRSQHSSHRKSLVEKKGSVVVDGSDDEVQEEEIPNLNTTYGMLFGPFESREDETLEWSPEKRTGTCDRKGAFARLVWSRKFVLIFHELSMTGAPMSMMELATEFLSCGASVSAVVLSKKGGLMTELTRRKIKVIEDREKLSFKVAMKADLIIAGSAVCASWIEQYLDHTVLGARQIVWWIMENRREYFNRSKLVLNRVKMLTFLSELQSKQWLAWCEEENIKLNSQPALIPLSVNDEFAFAAGITCSLNTPAFTTEKMLEKRQLLRNLVRKEMGLTDNDMLVMSLSSINPGKGQFLLLESARLMIEGESRIEDSAESSQDHQSRALLHKWNLWNKLGNSSTELHPSNGYYTSLNNPKKKRLMLLSHLFGSTDSAEAVDTSSNIRKILSESEEMQQKSIKVLIGSVGSKCNKVPYVKALLRFLSQHPSLSKAVLWTPATTHVASLYAAADVYIINSQGVGETFGRVTIEAMAFGLPVLGTDAGGTKEIIEHNVTGLLHPLGRQGAHFLSENLKFLLENPSARQAMGIRGRKLVEKKYLKRHMYKKFAGVLFKCMRIK